MRISAVSGLEKIRSKEVVKPLLLDVKDEYKYVREKAVFALLKQVRSEEDIDFLIVFL